MGARRPLLTFAIGFCLVTCLGWVVTHSPYVPYNVRELVREDRPVVSLLLLSALLYWSFAVPVWIAMGVVDGGSRGWLFPGLVVLHGLGAWALLRGAVPLESIEDVVGSPVLGWPGEWETIGRWLALFGGASLVTTLAAVGVMTIRLGKWNRLVPYSLASAAILAILVHWVVVSAAATDNLTELMARGGDAGGSLLLACFWAVIATTGSVVALQAFGRGPRLRLGGLALLAVSYPVAFLALDLGTENRIQKYGQVFSALQFLLSSDRAHLARGMDLAFRYVALHTAAVVGISWFQLPVWWWLLATRETDRRPRRG